MMRQTKSSRGFTLIETLVYLALYVVIILGVLSAVYSMFESNARNQTIAMVEQEGNFLSGKIEWVLSDTNVISTPVSSGSTLTVTKFDGSVHTVSLSGDDMRIQESSNPTQILNNSNVSVTHLTFTHTHSSADGINPESVQVAFTLDATTSDGFALSRDFSTLKYIRK